MQLPEGVCLGQPPQHSAKVVCAHGSANEYGWPTELSKLRAQICGALLSSEDYMPELPSGCKDGFENNRYS